jgi:pimeloyl-ACP methyl ester carboxylesterase
MNPRLTQEWLQYLVPIGARRDGDGWRWKIDPVMRFGGFGPWRPSWSMELMRNLGQPTLGLLPLIQEEMGWGTLAEDVLAYLPHGGRLEVLDDLGHFAHVEDPDRIATLTLEFLQ